MSTSERSYNHKVLCENLTMYWSVQNDNQGFVENDLNSERFYEERFELVEVFIQITLHSEKYCIYTDCNQRNLVIIIICIQKSLFSVRLVSREVGIQSSLH